MAITIKTKKPSKKSIIILSVLAALLMITTVIAIAITDKRPVQSDFFDTNEKYVSGIDVSQHNGKIEWDKVAEHTDFAIIRAGYRGYGNGTIVEDSRFKENMKNATKEDIHIGAYFYSQATTPEEAEEEAEFVLDLIRPYDIDLPIFIDFEYSYDADGKLAGRLFNADLSGREAADIINAFCEKIIESGYRAGVYSSSSVYNFDIKMSAIADDIFVWVADYNSAVTYLGRYDIWQYSKNGSCDGVNSKYVDLNRWYIK